MKKTILLIQPPLLHSDDTVDMIQRAYWRELQIRVKNMLGETVGEKELEEFEYNFTGLIEPNIGLCYIAAVLSQAGYQIEYLDFHLLDASMRQKHGRIISDSDIAESLSAYQPDDFLFAGISPLTPNYHWAVRIAEAVKRFNSEVPVVIGGVHASFMYEEILENDAAVDYVVVGEGEETITELAEAFSSGGPSAEIAGLAYRDKGKVRYTGDRPVIEDLDTLPYPMYDIFPSEYLEKIILRVLTTRGCSNRCSFCVPASFFTAPRFRDPVQVVNELEHHHRHLGITTFMIGDLNFLSDYGYAERLCNELIRRNLPIIWMCQSRVNLVDKHIVTLMKLAGCVMICLGVESGDQNILEHTGKAITPEASLNAMKIIKNAGIKLFTFWVFGLPGETHSSAHTTITMLRELIDEGLIDYTHCTMLVPYPGTAVFTHPDRFGIKILSRRFSDYWLGCDYLGADIPVAETEKLTKYEIYAYWQMALAVVAGNINKIA